MVTQAVILLPEEKGQVLPSYLFSRVVGIPFLHRLIYCLWRTGVARVSILAKPEAKASLEHHLTEIKQNSSGSLQAYSNWQDLWDNTPDKQEDYPRLMLVANVLPTCNFLAEFVRFPVPPGQLALTVTAPSLFAEGFPSRMSRPAYQVILEHHRVTSIRFSPRLQNHCALGLVSFSKPAWHGWQQWQMSQNNDKAVSTSFSETALFGYLARQAQGKKVIGFESDPLSISLIQGNKDIEEASARLIAAAQGSPWGEGYLESSLNRKISRKILLHFSALALRVNPSLITFSDLLVGLVAVAGFLTGTYWGSLAAALLLPLIMVLDTLDGLLARLTFQETRQGRLLDLYGDTILNLLIFYGIAIGQYRATGRPLFLALLLPLTIGYVWCWRLTNPLREMSPEGATTATPVGSPDSMSGTEEVVRETSSRDFFYLILLCALFNRLDWFIMATAVGTILFALILPWLRRHDHI